MSHRIPSLIRRVVHYGTATTLLLLGSCLSPSVDEVGSPEIELADLLTDLEQVRGGDFDGDPSDEDGSPSSRAAQREADIVRAVRELSFIHPNYVPALVVNGALAFEQSAFDRAQKYLDQALELDPGHVPATLLRARVAIEEGNLIFARRVLREQLEVAPDDPALREAYAGVMYLMGEYEEASTQLDLVERLSDGAGWRTGYHQGLVAESTGGIEEALLHYQVSCDLNPDFEAAARRVRWLSVRDPEAAAAAAQAAAAAAQP